jgi:hypothetical protein
MTGFPHDGAASEPLDLFVEEFGGLDLADHRSPGVGGKNVPYKKDHKLISPYDVPFVVDNADPIRVSVISNPGIRFRFLDFCDQGFQRFRKGRIRVMIGEIPVHFTEKLDDVIPQSLEDGNGHETSGSIPGIHHDLEGFVNIDVIDHIFGVFGNDVIGIFRARCFLDESPFLDDPENVLDVRAVQGFFPRHDLEPVVFRGIVRSRDHDSGIHFFVIDGEIQEGRRNGSQFGDIASGGKKAVAQRSGVRRRAQPAVPSYRHMPPAVLAEVGADRLSQDFDRFLSEIFVDDSSNVVLSENFRFEIHVLLLYPFIFAVFVVNPGLFWPGDFSHSLE